MRMARQTKCIDLIAFSTLPAGAALPTQQVVAPGRRLCAQAQPSSGQKGVKSEWAWGGLTSIADRVEHLEWCPDVRWSTAEG